MDKILPLNKTWYRLIINVISEEPGQGNSWRLISHELDEDDGEDESAEKDEPDITTKQMAKVSFQRSHMAAVPPPAHGMTQINK